ncbi:MAG TPA: GDSL-type esterase/lipase family protein [Candidatus Methanoperedens sp.]|nr:GDSL-type esterase/lipase family protein [Candidatus Methanoperedens sp.]
MTKRARGILIGVGLAAGTVLVVLCLCEAALRLAGYRPPELVPTGVKGTYRFEPGASFTYVGYRPGSPVEFRTPIVLNQLGFHDRDYPFARLAERTFRVLVLGDSYVAAMEVETSRSFHKLLEARLNAENPLGRGTYEVIAFGQGNRAQEAELGWLKRFGPEYGPDLVLLVFFCGNDVMENSPATYRKATAFATSYQKVVAPRKLALYDRLFFLRRSRLSGFVAERAATFYAAHLDRFDRSVTREQLLGPDAEVYRVPPAAEWLEAWRITEGLLGQVRAETERQGAVFAMAVISGPQVIGEASQSRLWSGRDAGMDLEQPEKWVLAWCADHQVPCLSLGQAFREAGRERVFWRYDAHLTPFGHSVAAGALYPFLRTVAGGAAGTPSPR